MTQDCTEFFCALGERPDQNYAPDPQSAGGQPGFSGGSIFLNKTDSGERKRICVVKPASDTQAGQSFHARWQNAFAASLVGRKIAALDNDH